MRALFGPSSTPNRLHRSRSFGLRVYRLPKDEQNEPYHLRGDARAGADGGEDVRAQEAVADEEGGVDQVGEGGEGEGDGLDRIRPVSGDVRVWPSRFLILSWRLPTNFGQIVHVNGFLKGNRSPFCKLQNGFPLQRFLLFLFVDRGRLSVCSDFRWSVCDVACGSRAAHPS